MASHTYIKNLTHLCFCTFVEDCVFHFHVSIHFIFWHFAEDKPVIVGRYKSIGNGTWKFRVDLPKNKSREGGLRTVIWYEVLWGHVFLVSLIHVFNVLTVCWGQAWSLVVVIIKVSARDLEISLISLMIIIIIIIIKIIMIIITIIKMIILSNTFDNDNNNNKK